MKVDQIKSKKQPMIADGGSTYYGTLKHNVSAGFVQIKRTSGTNTGVSQNPVGSNLAMGHSSSNRFI